MPLCSRAVAEVQSLCRSSFLGVEMESPKALCCTHNCGNTLGTLRELATAALHEADVHAVTTCARNHTTRLQSFVGMLPGAEDANAAELLYWLRVVQHHAHRERSSAVGSCNDAGALPTAPMFISLATALIRWTAHVFNEAEAPAPRCPRVWVAVRHENASASPTLVLRPMCEHVECLHAVRTQLLHTMDGVTSLVAAHDDSTPGVSGARASTFSLRTLAEHSGRVLAALTQAAGYGDDLQTPSASNISTAVDDLLAELPADAQVSVESLADLHRALHKPLRWVQVVAHRQAVGGAVDAQSHLWLCKHHVKGTELARSQRHQKLCAEAVSMLVEWYWHDGQHSHVFDRLCTATLEHAFQSKLAEVVLRCSNHTQTVRFLPSGMAVKESGARVGRVSLKTYVASVAFQCQAVCGWSNAPYGVSDPAIRFRHIGGCHALTTTPVSS